MCDLHKSLFHALTKLTTIDWKVTSASLENRAEMVYKFE